MALGVRFSPSTPCTRAGMAYNLVLEARARKGLRVRLPPGAQIPHWRLTSKERIMSAAAMVLVLDAEWRPLRVDSFRRAWKKLVLGKVETVVHSHDQTITVSGRVTPMPSVVRVLKHFKREKIKIKFSRLNIYARDNWKCAYCGKKFMTEDLTFDHVFPQSRGGKTEWTNIVTCCGIGGNKCNLRKGNRTPEEAGMPLLFKPKKPTFLPAVNVKMDMRQIPEEWQGYWTLAL